MQFRRLKFHFSIVAGVMGIVGILTAALIFMVLSVANRSAAAAAESQFELISYTVRERTSSHFQPAFDSVEFLSSVPDILAGISEVDGVPDHSLIPLFLALFRSHSDFYSVYVGLSDGTFFQVINAAGNDDIISAHNAPGGTAYILRSITELGTVRSQAWAFFKDDGTLIGQQRDAEPEYDPRKRPWYQGAIEINGLSLSLPYIFNSLQQPGITVSFPAMTNDESVQGVLGIDMTLSNLADFVSNQKVSRRGGLALFADGSTLIAASSGFPEDMLNPDTINTPGEETENDRGSHMVRTEQWSITDDRNLVLTAYSPRGDLMEAAEATQGRIVRTSILVSIIIVPLVMLWALGLSRALRALSADAVRIGNFDFDGILQVKTPILEFWQLAHAFGIMKDTIASRTWDLRESNEKLEMLVEMGIAMSAERDIDRLSESILTNAKELTNADGGSLYLVNADRTVLDFSIVLNDSLGFEQGGTSGNPVGMKPVVLFNHDGTENHHNVVTHCFHTGKTLNIADAYDIDSFDFSGTRHFDESNGYRSTSFLTVPLKPRGGGKILGALQLINALNPVSGEVVVFSERIQPFVEALGSAAAVAVQNWILMKRQKDLFDELVRFVGSAIDGKSPYTARHCARVPKIARLLLKEAEAVETGPLKDFRLKDNDQRREFEVGAWLHDCGKVTTPEYIVDKSTKLETIYNRIHEIRTRFEVLLRDARILRHEAVLKGLDPDVADAELEETEKRLHDDFAFIAECNIGSESMGALALNRLRSIAERQWMRFFDNKLGLSWAEKRQLESIGVLVDEQTLPAKETLIADRLEHAIRRTEWTSERYQSYGFQLDVPELLYNRGELYNLSVQNGTLTDEDRFKINEHAAQTIIMLDQINFPDDLSRVTEYAGSHHEFADGTGYPRQLNNESLSIPSRILVIADIFEALTSSDRPYKLDKTLSETIRILYLMKTRGHIDGGLFDLLLTSGAYLRYAEKFLKPSQIDEVDITQFL